MQKKFTQRWVFEQLRIVEFFSYFFLPKRLEGKVYKKKRRVCVYELTIWMQLLIIWSNNATCSGGFSVYSVVLLLFGNWFFNYTTDHRFNECL